MKKNTSIEIICFLLILLFTYAGISKLADHTLFKIQLSRLVLIKEAAPALSYLLPVFEIVIACMIAMPILRLHGLYAALVLLVLFTTYLGWMIFSNAELPCTCGGVIQYLSWKQHVLFNSFFIIIAATGIYLWKKPAINLNIKNGTT